MLVVVDVCGLRQIKADAVILRTAAYLSFSYKPLTAGCYEVGPAIGVSSLGWTVDCCSGHL